MEKKILPLLELKINPNKGTLVSAIALVGSPAIESNFLAFSKEEPREIKFSINEERMELLGAAMIPDFAMYRNTKDVGEYMSVFSAETIREIAQTFAQKGFLNNMNLDHDQNKKANSFVFQSYIVDESKGINAPIGVDAPNGSWIIGVKVNDAAVWSDIKSGKTNGFSVEGFFDLFETSIDIQLSKEQIKTLQDFEEMLNEKKGCLMFFPDLYNPAQWKLKGIELAANAIELESEPHVTMLYGFNDYPGLTNELKEFIQLTLNESPLMIEFGCISKFQQPDKDVIKIDIYDCNGTLNLINSVLSDSFGIVSPWGNYKPHMTIGYTEPRPETSFSSDRASLWQFGFEYLNKGKVVYSDANGLHTDILIIK